MAGNGNKWPDMVAVRYCSVGSLRAISPRRPALHEAAVPGSAVRNRPDL